jgi:hypothetical protein
MDGLHLEPTAQSPTPGSSPSHDGSPTPVINSDWIDTYTQQPASPPEESEPDGPELPEDVPPDTDARVQAESESRLAEGAAERLLVVTTLPEGVGPGDLLLVTDESTGLEYNVTVPAGVTSGEEIKVACDTGPRLPRAIVNMEQFLTAVRSELEELRQWQSTNVVPSQQQAFAAIVRRLSDAAAAAAAQPDTGAATITLTPLRPSTFPSETVSARSPPPHPALPQHAPPAHLRVVGAMSEEPVAQPESAWVPEPQQEQEPEPQPNTQHRSENTTDMSARHTTPSRASSPPSPPSPPPASPVKTIAEAAACADESDDDTNSSVHRASRASPSSAVRLSYDSPPPRFRLEIQQLAHHNLRAVEEVVPPESEPEPAAGDDTAAVLDLNNEPRPMTFVEADLPDIPRVAPAPVPAPTQVAQVQRSRAAAPAWHQASGAPAPGGGGGGGGGSSAALQSAMGDRMEQRGARLEPQEREHDEVREAGSAVDAFEERNSVIHTMFRDMVAVCGNVVQEAERTQTEPGGQRTEMEQLMHADYALMCKFRFMWMQRLSDGTLEMFLQGGKLMRMDSELNALQEQFAAAALRLEAEDLRQQVSALQVEAEPE